MTTVLLPAACPISRTTVDCLPYLQDYKELTVRLSDIPVNEFTASELLRLCLRKQDSEGSDSEGEDDASEEGEGDDVVSV